MKRFIWAWLAVFLVAAATTVSAANNVIVFDKSFVRGTGEPVMEPGTFSGCAGPARMVLINGSAEDGEYEKVSSSTITFNAVEIFGSSNFNQNVDRLESAVSVRDGNNTVAVTLKSKPNGRIRVQIVQDTDVLDCDKDGSSPQTGDCDDRDAAINPGAYDATCNAIDEDCSGIADDDYSATPTACGVGACASTGFASCSAGTVVDSCTAGTPAASDASCDNTDDDCDGAIDEDFAGEPTNCGIGGCAATGSTSCVNGSVQNSCVLGTPGTEVCEDGIDQDCDGTDMICDYDADGDGFEGADGDGRDCNDLDPAINPAAIDTCADGIDQNCDGVDPECSISYYLPDTGQTSSYTGTFGEDSDYNINPLSYTDNGNGMVTDNNTGLIWQQQGDGFYGTWDDANAYCVSLPLDGGGWRLPTKKELISIVDYGRYYPAIDTTAFPSTNSSTYWSSTSVAFNTINAWHVYFDGSVDPSSKSNDRYARCVRGGKQHNPFSINSGEKVTDNITGLEWQRQDDGVQRTWENAISYCENMMLTGQDDWRLPNIKELESITDDSRYNPAIDPDAFLDTKSYIYWSSTTHAEYPGYAWSLYFYSAGVTGNIKDHNYYVRCVRGGGQ